MPALDPMMMSVDFSARKLKLRVKGILNMKTWGVLGRLWVFRSQANESVCFIRTGTYVGNMRDLGEK